MTPSNIIPRTTTGQSTDTYFTNLAIPPFAVPADQESAIETFFESVTGDKVSGKLMADAVIYSANAQGLNPMSVVSDFKKLPVGELDIKISSFLNLTRVNTSLLGVTNSKKTGYFVQRSILP